MSANSSESSSTAAAIVVEDDHSKIRDDSNGNNDGGDVGPGDASASKPYGIVFDDCTRKKVDAVITSIMPRQLSRNELDLLGRWPSLLSRFVAHGEWLEALDRVRTHPEEIGIVGKMGGLNVLHTACLRYPPTNVILAMLSAMPDAALVQNHNGETPLHLASYGASDEVQEVLIRAQPSTVSVVDKNGDSPLHFAAREGAAYPLMRPLVKAAPQMISKPNNRGVTPFWLLPRSYLKADSLEDILEEDEDEDSNWRFDWDLLILFLRHTYFCCVNETLNADGGRRSGCCQDVQDSGEADDEQEDYSWVVHAAAATPACPREVLRFLCRIFPDHALRYDHGMTPLLLATQAEEREETIKWDSKEDGFREEVEARQEEDDDDNGGDVSGSSQTLDDTKNIMVTSDQTVVGLLLDWSESSASYADKDGRFPLEHALVAGKSWRAVQRLVAANPTSLECRDKSTGFLMFQLSAINSPELDTVYTIVRAQPQQVVVAMTQQPSGDASSNNERATKRARLK